jgi:hypothetical protein
MYNRRRQSEAAQRATERRQREDDAPRLKQQISGLMELRLEIEERLGDSAIAAARHTRHIIVDRAPALFDLPCTENSCREGGHDMTGEIMRGLRSGATEFTGHDACLGRLGAGADPCRRVLHYVAFAKYAAAPDDQTDVHALPRRS